MVLFGQIGSCKCRFSIDVVDCRRYGFTNRVDSPHVNPVAKEEIWSKVYFGRGQMYSIEYLEVKYSSSYNFIQFRGSTAFKRLNNWAMNTEYTVLQSLLFQTE